MKSVNHCQPSVCSREAAVGAGKEINVNLQAMTSGRVDRKVKVTECHNLVESRDGSFLELAPVALMAVSSCGKPVTVVHHAVAGRIAFEQHANRLRAIYPDRDSDRRVVELCNISGRLLTGVEAGVGKVCLMTTAGPLTVIIDDEGNCRVRGNGDDLPRLRFSAISEMTMTSRIDGAGLQGDYSVRAGVLDGDDARQLTADLLSAYSQLAGMAAATGCCMQPVIARYRYLDSYGETIYRSAPVLVMPGGGFQCMDSVEMTFSDSMRYRYPSALTATFWRMSLSTCGDEGSTPCSEVAQLVIETTGPIHPVDLGGVAANSIVATGTSDAVLKSRLPGTSAGMAATTSLPLQRVKGLVDCGDESFAEVKRVYRPFSQGNKIEVEFDGNVDTGSGVAGQVVRVDNLCRKRVERIDNLMARCRVPHRFVATTGTNLGEHMAWGDITPIRFEGYGPAEMALEVGEGVTWQGASEVTMADGSERVVAIGWGTEGAPLTFSPLLSYPSADAVKMTISLRRGSEIYRQTFPLTPTADGSSALYLSPSGHPIELTDRATSFSFPTPTEVVHRYADGVVSCQCSDPYNPVSAARPSASAVTAIAAVDRRGGSWEYSRRRLYVFTLGGTILANLDASGCWATFHRFDRRRVSGVEAVTETSDDRYPLVCVAGDDLVGLTRGSMKLICRGVAGSALGWDASRGRLWVAGTDGRVRIMDLNGVNSTFGGFAVKGMLTAGEGLLIDDGSGLRDLLGDSSNPTLAGYTVEIALPRGRVSLQGVRIRAINLELECSDIDGTLLISDEAGRMISQARIKGSVDAELPLRLVAPPISIARISLHFALRPSSRLSLKSLRLIYTT